MKKYKIVLLSLPKLIVDGPLLSLGQLTSIIKSNGFECKFLDFNAWLYHKTINSEFGYIWDTTDNTLIEDSKFIKFNQKFNELFTEYYSTNISPHDPEIIGLSSLSHFSWPSIVAIGNQVRKLNSNIKILLGGPSISQKTIKSSMFLNKLKKNNLIDDYITGDAEISIIEYLKGNKDFPGINNISYNNNFNRNNFPPPDYSDIDFSLYKNLTLSISGSRGCVRSCAFCNVPKIWPNFINKSGEKVARELIYLYEQHFKTEPHTFKFVDSLINGNLKEFNSMINVLSDYKDHNAETQLYYGGQYILRENVKLNDPFFDKLANSGCRYLTIGFESGSEKVRFEIGKPFTNNSIKTHLEEFRRVKHIRIVPLMLIGFPTETDEDFNESLKILDLFHENKDIISHIAVDHTMIIISGTPVYDNWEKYGIHPDTVNNIFEWKSNDNDYKKRLERFFIFLNKAIDLKLYEKPTVSGKTISAGNDYIQKFQNLDPKVVEIIKTRFSK